MFTLVLEATPRGNKHQFILTHVANPERPERSMAFSPDSTANLVKALVSMVRRTLNGWRLDTMKAGRHDWAMEHERLHALGKTLADWLGEHCEKHPIVGRHPMVKSLLNRFKRAALSASELHMLFANSDDKQSIGARVEKFQIDGIDVRVRMHALNLDQHEILLTARLILPNRVNQQVRHFNRSMYAMTDSRIELSKIVRISDLVTYHELLTAMRKMPAKALMDAIPALPNGSF